MLKTKISVPDSYRKVCGDLEVFLKKIVNCQKERLAHTTIDSLLEVSMKLHSSMCT
jgi:hypothetical protein